MKFTQNIALAAVAIFGLCGCALANYGAPSYSGAAAPAAYVEAAPAYGRSQADPVYSPENADAAASAYTDVAAAKASAAKLQHLNLAAVDRYGYQIGVPLLVRNYGRLTPLYSALAPKRSFVGTVDAG
ncbi:chorion protein S16 [Musca vetustissima]|uniref:chorion protein S16 n=1 Tax=Musca vetustissima TaxID=27455 RepID=UPI002AB6C307|nr:chorion protein S16 [Musca vetustissima]